MPLCLSHLLNTTPAGLYFNKQNIQVLDLEMKLVWRDFNFHIMTRCLKLSWSSLRSPEEQRVRGGKEGRTPGLKLVFQPREFQRCLFYVLFFSLKF